MSAPAPVPGRLTVRPREMAMGTRTERAGEQRLDSLPNYRVYVSQQCVGPRRCPLVMLLSGGGYGAEMILQLHAKLAEQSGMILLAPEPVTPGRFDLLLGYMNDELTVSPPPPPRLVSEFPNAPDLANLDAALRQVLRTYPIDPTKIGVGGMSDGGSYALFLGLNNLDIFSRVAVLSPGIYFGGTGPANPATQFFLVNGLAEGATSFFQNPLKAARDLRRAGHPLTQVLSLRRHEHRAEDYAWMWRWFQASWAPADSAARPVSQPAVDSVPVLTTEAVTAFLAFWTSVMPAPDSSPEPARRAYLTEVVIPVGAERLSALVTDIPALAAHDPAVAAALQRAGLTAPQAAAYRLALISAQATQQADAAAGPVPATSVLGQNVGFLNAHADDLGAALAASHMWSVP